MMNRKEFLQASAFSLALLLAPFRNVLAEQQAEIGLHEFIDTIWKQALLLSPSPVNKMFMFNGRTYHAPLVHFTSNRVHSARTAVKLTLGRALYYGVQGLMTPNSIRYPAIEGLEKITRRENLTTLPRLIIARHSTTFDPSGETAMAKAAGFLCGDPALIETCRPFNYDQSECVMV